MARTAVARGALYDVEGLMFTCDPSNPTQVGRRPYTFPHAWETLEVLRGDGPLETAYFYARFVSANVLLAITDQGTFETRPPDTDGWFEQLRMNVQPDSQILLYRAQPFQRGFAPLRFQLTEILETL